MHLDFLKGFEFFTGVPDSQLKALCSFLLDQYGISVQHIIAANEGNAVGIAAGYHLATGKVPVVYLQNSGLGNIVNPVASLLHKKVYGIPCFFIVGWRGEPGVPDEPQHIFQGESTLEFLEQMQIPYFVIGSDTPEIQVLNKLEEYRVLFQEGRQAAFVIRKGALEYNNGKTIFENQNQMHREDIIAHILDNADPTDIFVSTTGKTSRELFELREARKENHANDFLTVGSMGHSSSLALGISLAKHNRRIWCIDGDGSVLMHMGSMAVIGANSPKNMIHVVINNESHESVGAMPTVAGKINLLKIAEGCGYQRFLCVDNVAQLEESLHTLTRQEGLSFLEVKAAIGARENLGRPTRSPYENKMEFMQFLNLKG